MRGALFALLAVLVGGAMIGGGVWGVIGDVTDDDGSSSSTTVELPRTSSIEECSQVAERDKRFRLPRDLTFGPYGRAIVKCKGGSVAFTLDIDSAELKPTTFYEVVLEKGRREESIGSMLTPPSGVDWLPTTVTVGPEVRLRRYDFLTVREDPFHAPKDAPPAFPLSAAL